MLKGDVMEIEAKSDDMNRVYRDAHGIEIREFDVLKVFHFIGARRKVHYMYKWVRRNSRGELAILHLDAPHEPMVILRAVSCNGVIACAEIANRC